MGENAVRSAIDSASLLLDKDITLVFSFTFLTISLLVLFASSKPVSVGSVLMVGAMSASCAHAWHAVGAGQLSLPLQPETSNSHAFGDHATHTPESDTLRRILNFFAG